MATELGEPVSFGGRALSAFPAPQRLASLDGFPGLAGRKRMAPLPRGCRPRRPP